MIEEMEEAVEYLEQIRNEIAILRVREFIIDFMLGVRAKKWAGTVATVTALKTITRKRGIDSDDIRDFCLENGLTHYLIYSNLRIKKDIETEANLKSFFNINEYGILTVRRNR
jgi:hypothetical protein